MRLLQLRHRRVECLIPVGEEVIGGEAPCRQGLKSMSSIDILKSGRSRIRGRYCSASFVHRLVVQQLGRVSPEVDVSLPWQRSEYEVSERSRLRVYHKSIALQPPRDANEGFKPGTKFGNRACRLAKTWDGVRKLAQSSRLQRQIWSTRNRSCQWIR